MTYESNGDKAVVEHGKPVLSREELERLAKLDATEANTQRNIAASHPEDPLSAERRALARRLLLRARNTRAGQPF